MMLLPLILLPLVSFTFYTSPMVLGQENHTSKVILICQMEEYIEAPSGSNMQQLSNICSYQNSIGYNQSIAELCFILSGKSSDIINAFCDKESQNQIAKPATAPIAVNETDNTLNSQNNMNDGSRLTIFDGVSNFFSNMFNH